MSSDRIHVYELTERLDRAVPWEVHSARVVVAGGPVELGTDVVVSVLDTSELDDAVVKQLTAACGTARKIRDPTVSSPLDFGTFEPTDENARAAFW